MKKLTTLLFAVAVFVFACNDNTTPSNNDSSASANNAPTAPVDNSPYAAGKGVYQRTCIVCHQPDGTGLEGTYPPLAKSDFLLADKRRAILQVILGSSNAITVNGKKYNSLMPAQSNLKDDEVAAVLNYVFHSFDNNGFTVTEADVKAVRDSAANAEKSSPYYAGKIIYSAKCASCHSADGAATRVCPPLAGSAYLLSNKKRTITQLIKGTSEEITVDGKKYSGSMPAEELSDEDAAAVINYITHSFGNKGYTVTEADVKSAR
ncbi:MAG TPA: c-type cytochrome [Bacteroidia bacterium]|jgi:mono/diheme cytochrome c family protein|nr:c-type cytochrome [Bacteroidia bacterium]